MNQATLHTDRLRLTPLSERHLDAEVALDADPQVMRFLGDGRPRSRPQVIERHRERLAVAAAHPGLGFWVGESEGDVVGWWLLEPVLQEGVPRSGEVELGYRLFPRFWRRGLATEGSAALLRHAFTTLAVRRVMATTMAVNVASRATMSGLGLRYVRTFHEHHDVPIPGTEHGEVEYDITLEQWRARTTGDPADER